MSIFDIKTVHRSGFNFTDKFRINFECRVHKISDKFNVCKEKYFFNKKSIQNL